MIQARATQAQVAAMPHRALDDEVSETVRLNAAQADFPEMRLRLLVSKRGGNIL